MTSFVYREIIGKRIPSTKTERENKWDREGIKKLIY
jgi:hypothetical protein